MKSLRIAVARSIEMLLITGVVVALCVASTFTFRPATSLNSLKEGVESFSIRAGPATQRSRALTNSSYLFTEKSSQKQSRFNPLIHLPGLSPEVLSLSNTSFFRLLHINCCFLPYTAFFYSKNRGRAPPLLT